MPAYVWVFLLCSKMMPIQFTNVYNYIEHIDINIFGQK